MSQKNINQKIQDIFVMVEETNALKNKEYNLSESNGFFIIRLKDQFIGMYELDKLRTKFNVYNISINDQGTLSIIINGVVA